MANGKSRKFKHGTSVSIITDDILGMGSSINLRVKGGADEWLNKVKQNTQYR